MGNVFPSPWKFDVISDHGYRLAAGRAIQQVFGYARFQAAFNFGQWLVALVRSIATYWHFPQGLQIL